MRNAGLIVLVAMTLAACQAGKDSVPGSTAANNATATATAAGDSYQQQMQRWLPAAREGDPVASFNIGAVHENGRTVARNEPVALAWYMAAARQGFAPACYRAGLMVLQGRGAEADPARGLKLLQCAANGGHPRARADLCRMQEQGKVRMEAAAREAWCQGSTADE